MRRVVFVIAAIVGASCHGSPGAPTGISVTSVSPLSGTTLGGTAVTIVGQNFTAGATVTVGGVPATAVQVMSPRTISATTGQHASGAADITVVSGGKSSTLPAAFTFVAPAPAVNSPPVIVSITARGTRPNEPAGFADLGEEVNLTSVVQDAETAAADFT